MKTINAENFNDLLMKIGDALNEPTNLLLIGSTIGIHLGQPDRSTSDIDIWINGSHLNQSDLLQVCKVNDHLPPLVNFD